MVPRSSVLGKLMVESKVESKVKSKVESEVESKAEVSNGQKIARIVSNPSISMVF